MQKDAKAKLKSRWAWLLLTIAILVAVAGCDGPTGPYKAFTLKKGVGHFSFEYPSGYKIGIVDVRDDRGYVDMTLTGTPGDGQWLVYMAVFIAREDSGPPNPSADLEKSISFWQGQKDFELLDRSTLVIAEMQAEQVTYSYQKVLRPIGPNPSTYMPVVNRAVYFALGDCVWSLSVSIPEGAREAGMADFDHVLQTFRILE